MKNHDKIASRLALILQKLNGGERLHIDELAREFGVSKRTIQRDLNERFAFLDLQYSDHCYALKAHYLNALNMEDIKRFAFLSGLKGLYPHFDDVFIARLLDDVVAQAYLVRGYQYEKIDNGGDSMFVQIEQAVTAKVMVEFEYAQKKRIVAPYKVANIQGGWYLAGVQKGKVKTFALRKIKNFKATTEEFVPCHEVLELLSDEQNTWFSTKALEVVLRINHAVAGHFRSRSFLPHQQVLSSLEDGGLIVICRASYDQDILRIVRYWMPHIEIISPDFLKEELLEGLQTYIDR